MSVDNVLDPDLPASITADEMLTSENQLIRFAIKAAVVTFTIFIVTVSGCSMQGNMYEASVLAEEVKMKEQSVRVAEAQARVDIERIQSMERMIQAGANPIAIRCMDKGWNNDTTCMAVGIALSKIDPPTEPE